MTAPECRRSAFWSTSPSGRPPPPVALPALAAHITGDTKALNHGTTLATLIMRALALRESIGPPGLGRAAT